MENGERSFWESENLIYLLFGFWVQMVHICFSSDEDAGYLLSTAIPVWGRPPCLHAPRQEKQVADPPISQWVNRLLIGFPNGSHSNPVSTWLVIPAFFFFFPCLFLLSKATWFPQGTLKTWPEPKLLALKSGVFLQPTNPCYSHAPHPAPSPTRSRKTS